MIVVPSYILDIGGIMAQEDEDLVPVGTTPTIDKLASEKLTPVSVLAVLLEIPSKISYHKTEYFKNRKRQLDAQRKYDVRKAVVYEECKQDRSKQWTESRLKIHIDGDVETQKLREEVEKWELGCEFHSMSMDKLREISLTLRNYIEYQSFLEGGK